MLAAFIDHAQGIFVLCVLSMLVMWITHIKTKNASWVDVGWSFNFTLITLYLMIVYRSYSPSAIGLAFMYLFWSLRLSGHLLARMSHEGEDFRYGELRAKWGTSATSNLSLVFLGQTLLNIVLSLPLFVLWSDSSAEFDLIRKLAVVLWVVALWGESKADRQLEKFKRNPLNASKVCRQQFWRFSRHPNYFFEWLVWVSFAMFSMSSPMGWLSLTCPVLMFLFLRNWTGVPWVEKRLLRTRGKSYEQYIKSTSAFFPWFPKDDQG